MKKALAIISLLAFALASYGDVTKYHSLVARKKAASGGGETVFQENDGSSQILIGSSSDEWACFPVTPTKSTTVTSIDVKLQYYTGDGSDVISAAIYTDNGSGEPGILVGEENSRDLSLTASQVYYNFVTNASVTGSTQYIIVVKTPTGGMGGANRLWVTFDNTYTSGKDIKESGDAGSTWSTTQSDKGSAYKLYE